MRDEAECPHETLAEAAAPAAALSGVALARGGARILDGLDLTVPAAGVTAIMGPNGAGKSVTLRLLAGLIAPMAGRVTWGAEGRARPERNEVALVFQKPVLLRRTVRANLAHALSAYGMPRRDRTEEIERLLAAGDLAHLADRPARVLSGGEQQRLSMVRALAMRPRLLLLDEPTASLDPRATFAIEALVRRAAADGVAAAMVTHNLGQASRLAARVAFLNRGRVTEVTPIRDFVARPRSAEARAYLDGDLLL